MIKAKTVEKKVHNAGEREMRVKRKMWVKIRKMLEIHPLKMHLGT